MSDDRPLFTSLQRFPKGNLCTHKLRFPRTPEHGIPHLLLEKTLLTSLKYKTLSQNLSKSILHYIYY